MNSWESLLRKNALNLGAKAEGNHIFKSGMTAMPIRIENGVFLMAKVLVRDMPYFS
jgi:hypothetical protein